MSPAKLGVGPLEMEILGILNGQADLSVADIQTRLKTSGNDLAYTTVMTVVGRLFEKGLVKRVKEGRQYLYTLSKGRGEQPGPNVGIFQRIRHSLFRGERLKPILALLDSGEDLTKEELQELKRAVDAKLRKMER